MKIPCTFRYLYSAVLILCLVTSVGACASTSSLPNQAVIEKRAEALNTTGPSDRRARELLTKTDWTFDYPTVIVGMEKSYFRYLTDDTRNVGAFLPSEKHIPERIRSHFSERFGDVESNECVSEVAEEQEYKARKIFDDNSRAFVSHILSYEPRTDEADPGAPPRVIPLLSHKLRKARPSSAFLCYNSGVSQTTASKGGTRPWRIILPFSPRSSKSFRDMNSRRRRIATTEAANFAASAAGASFWPWR